MCLDCNPSTLSLSRRHLLRGSVGLSAAAMAGMLGWPGTAAATTAAPALAPDAVVKELVAGNARHVAGVQTCTDFLGNRATLAKGQHPMAIVLGCSDSRVSPEYVFDQAPGGLFVVRVAGNFVDTDGLASMEYAVGHLGVPVIVVLGHSACGAVTAAVEVEQKHVSLPGHLPALAEHLAPPVRTALAGNPPDPVAAAIRANVLYTMERLKTEESEVAEAIHAGKVTVVGGVYDLASGTVTFVKA
ncbi:carbonic anhydrase [Ancylobacter lacus]|uniref:carbonic anhydrase n=1 Tax=Ancylobacter lacus TaxID=2579970 RepID=UPI001FE8B2B5|nr:carbonic anhydrase [Ancylobacter lacus]